MTTTPVLLQFNCSYARTAVNELTSKLAAGKVGRAARVVNHNLKAEAFQGLFNNLPSFGIPKGYYEATSPKRPPVFEAWCGAILDAFVTNWNLNCKQQEYLMAFT